VNQIESEVIKTVKYFAFFKYPPSFDQIHEFLGIKISDTNLKSTLDRMVLNKKLISSKKRFLAPLEMTMPLNSEYRIQNTQYYTIPPHRIYYKNRLKNQKDSLIKENITANYIRLISHLPQIKLIGYSGSIAMKNTESDDDIDLFIITTANRIWTARFLANIIAIVLRIKRSRLDRIGANKICLNMFFDERDLILPLAKHNNYTAHEVLQMRPVVVKEDIYQRFISANSWVFQFFPNAKDSLKFRVQNSELKFRIYNSRFLKILNSKFLILNLVGDSIELILKHLQLAVINRHRTCEIITDTQLWFFPDDFEKTLINTDLVIDSHS